MPQFHLAPLDLRPDSHSLQFSPPSTLFALPAGKTTTFQLPRLELNGEGEFADPIVASLPSHAAGQAPGTGREEEGGTAGTAEIQLESNVPVLPNDERKRTPCEDNSGGKASILSWDNLNNPTTSSYDSPFISGAPASIIETIAFKFVPSSLPSPSLVTEPRKKYGTELPVTFRTKDKRFEGQSYTQNLFKVILGTETTLFARNSVNEPSYLTGKALGRERDEEGVRAGTVEIQGVSDQTALLSDESQKSSILSWDRLNHPTTSSYGSPFISEAPALIIEAVAFKTEDRRFEGESYTHDQLLVGNLFKVIFGTETTLFAWDSVNERFGWRGGVDAKGKGREGRLIGCSIGDTQLLVEPYLALGSAFVRLEMIVKDLTATTSTSNPSTSASHSVADALASFRAYARQELSHLTTPSSTFLRLSTKFSPLQTTLDTLLRHFQRPLTLSPPYPSQIQLSARHLLSNLFDSLDESLRNSGPKLDQVVLAWLFDGVLRGWWRGWEEWVGITSSEGGVGEAWRECGIEVRESIVDSGTEESSRTDTRSHRDAGVEYIFHTSQIPSFFPRETAIALFESGRALRILQRSTTPLSVSSKGRNGSSNAPSPNSKGRSGYEIPGSGRGLIWDYGECLRYHEFVEFTISRNRRTLSSTTEIVRHSIDSTQETPTAQEDSANRIEQDVPASKYHSEIAVLFSLFDDQPGTSPLKYLRPKAPTPLIQFLSSLLSNSPKSQSILPPQTPSLAILLQESLWSPLTPVIHSTQSILLKRLFTNFKLREELRMLGRVWLFSDRRCGVLTVGQEGAGGGRGVGFMSELEEILFRCEGFEDELPGGKLLERRRKRDLVSPASIRTGGASARGKGNGGTSSGGRAGEGREERGTGLAVRLDWKGSSGVELSLALRECLARGIEEFVKPFSSSSTLGGELVMVGRRMKEGERGEARIEEKRLIDRLSFSFDFEGSIDPLTGTGHHKDSLEALSFLTLSYTPLSPLTLIITPKVLKQYSKFFSRILVLLRIQTVLSGISRGVLHPLSPSSRSGIGKEDREGRRYLFGAGEGRRLLVGFSFRLLTTTKALLDYFFTFAISDSCAEFDKAIDTFLGRLFPPPLPSLPSCSPSPPHPSAHVPTTTPSPIQKSIPTSNSTSHYPAEPTLNALTTLHATHLKTLSTRLLLEKHQTGLVEIIDGIFHLVLRFGKLIIDSRRAAEGDSENPIEGVREEGEGGEEEVVREMKAELERRNKLLIKVLTSLSERGGPSAGRTSVGRGGGGYADELLSRLS